MCASVVGSETANPRLPPSLLPILAVHDLIKAILAGRNAGDCGAEQGGHSEYSQSSDVGRYLVGAGRDLGHHGGRDAHCF